MEVIEACIGKTDWFLRTVERTKREANNLPLEYKEYHYERLERLRNALLMFTNAIVCCCGHFEPPIDSERRKLEAFRISLDLWDDPSLIDRYMESCASRHTEEELQTIASWRDVLAGPLVCMETYGDRALFLCDGHVFEAVSLGRQWDEMIPFTPDLVVTSLLPYEGMIVLGGFTTKHSVPLRGPWLDKVNEEFRAACNAGIIDDSERFRAASRELRALHEKEGVEPNSWAVHASFVDWLNEVADDWCFPYEPTLRLRDEE